MNIKNLFIFLIVSALASQLSAQKNEPVRLALITETDEASTALDVLTAQLSGNPKIQLLERNEIEKVYREQGLSAENKDYLKLGQILGADGLLLLDVVRTPQATNLTARLIAVKPGVVLTDGSFPWPLTDTAQWAESVSTYLDSFVPKLTVLVKDAIPISVVNLRSAVQSADALETERKLKLLTIQRLSQERQLFVLERQKMQLLTGEKDLKLDDSAFWNGSYLLEGVVDQHGYSKDTITLDARLTPPNGGVPLQFEVSGSRTNLTEVINQLASKVDEALKVNSTVPAWNTADEAAKYFDEAKWAMRWGVYSEAQASSDSAWALGKRDMDCVTIQIKAYMSEMLAEISGFQGGENTYSLPYDVNGKPMGPPPDDTIVQADLNDVIAQHPYGFARKVRIDQGAKIVDFVFANQQPDPKEIDHALHALELYYAFCQTLSPDEPKVDSDWYRLGIEDLIAASQVLQHFHFVPESQQSVADKLADLRAQARSVAERISKSPSVHDSYFSGDGTITSDEGDKLYHAIEESPNIFSCKVKWGCFWQETPEDGVALYRELMSSPVFSYIHDDFWLRDLQTPRLAAWNESDRQRVPTVWGNFAQELDASTNVLLQLEGKALALADAGSESDIAGTFTNFFDFIFSNHDSLLLVGADGLVSAKTGNWAGGDELNRLFYTTYNPKLETMNQEYWNTISQGATSKSDLTAFEKQKEYLKDNKPFDPREFVHVFMFGFRDYSKAQALEIQPLLAAYKAKLTGPMAMIGAVQFVGQVESDVARILNPPAPSLQPQLPRPQIQPQTPNAPVVATVAAPAPVAAAAVAAPAPVSVPEIVTNVVVVNTFLAIPWDNLLHLESSEKIIYSSAKITAHHWFEEKLVLDFEYEATINSRYETGSAIAILDPASEHWEVIGCPEYDMPNASEMQVVQARNSFYHRSVLLHGELFASDNKQIRKYDFQNKQWQVLTVSDGNNYELFVVNDRLYAANGNIIFEIIDGGNSSRILASTRRQPPVSVLDTEDLGTPTLFEGPEHSLRVSTQSKIFTWEGNDWREDSAVPPSSQPPAITPDGVMFRLATDGLSQTMSIFYLPTGTNSAELCLWQKVARPNQVISGGSGPAANTDNAPKPLWKMPPDLVLASLPAARYQGDMYLLVNHSEKQNVVDPEYGIIGGKYVEKDGYHAGLLCLSRDLSAPQKIYLKFDAPDGCPPGAGDPGSWMFFSSNLLFFGLESSRKGMMPVVTGQHDIFKLGVWLMPLSQIEPAITAQKQTLLAEQEKASGLVAAAMEQSHKDILAKYDRNHNGVIDADEKEAALNDPEFIESELDVIDANHNGWLDADELVYFDANKNQILEPKEQAGIDIAQHLLAARLMKKFDANGDGVLDHAEFNELRQSCNFRSNTSPGRNASIPFPDDNHDGKIDLGELETFLKQQTRSGLRMRGTPGATLMNQMVVDSNQPLDARQLFKLSVESYWKNHGGNVQ